MGKSETEKVKASAAQYNNWAKTWGQPLFLGVITLAGLIGALVKDAYWDLFFCFLLCYPIFKIVFHYYRK